MKAPLVYVGCLSAAGLSVRDDSAAVRLTEPIASLEFDFFLHSDCVAELDFPASDVFFLAQLPAADADPPLPELAAASRPCAAYRPAPPDCIADRPDSPGRPSAEL